MSLIEKSALHIAAVRNLDQADAPVHDHPTIDLAEVDDDDDVSELASKVLSKEEIEARRLAAEIASDSEESESDDDDIPDLVSPEDLDAHLRLDAVARRSPWHFTSAQVTVSDANYRDHLSHSSSPNFISISYDNSCQVNKWYRRNHDEQGCIYAAMPACDGERIERTWYLLPTAVAKPQPVGRISQVWQVPQVPVSYLNLPYRDQTDSWHVRRRKYIRLRGATEIGLWFLGTDGKTADLLSGSKDKENAAAVGGRCERMALEQARNTEKDDRCVSGSTRWKPGTDIWDRAGYLHLAALGMSRPLLPIPAPGSESNPLTLADTPRRRPRIIKGPPSSIQVHTRGQHLAAVQTRIRELEAVEASSSGSQALAFVRSPAAAKAYRDASTHRSATERESDHEARRARRLRRAEEERELYVHEISRARQWQRERRMAENRSTYLMWCARDQTFNGVGAATRIRRRAAPDSVAVVGWRPPQDPPLTHAMLYRNGAAPSNQPVPVQDHHKCGICHLVKSHPVSYLCGHIHCYVCIRMWLEHAFTCPSCVTTITRAPFRQYAEEAAIAAGYPEWKDDSDVDYDFYGIIFPKAAGRVIVESDSE
ncbi:hypothetical protein C8R44DRAFT_734102 [Mycena epipterygia]|nr:hypothetical protein C8R44DRAFT_734102 [Mycena epipterygia]